MENIKEFILDIAKESGRISLEFLGHAKISEKKPGDVVTEADLAVEKYLITKIKEKFPNHKIYSEESGVEEIESDYVWYLDPIDGTHNYSHSDPHFAVSIALAKNNEIIYGCIFLPMMDEMYFAKKGEGAYLNDKKITVSIISDLKKSFIQLGITPYALKNSMEFVQYFANVCERARDYGFCAGQLCYVAAGRADGLVKMSQNPWDFAAGILIVTEAGGKVTDDKGDNIIMGKSYQNVIATNSLIHSQIIDHLNNGLKHIDKKQNWWKSSSGGNKNE